MPELVDVAGAARELGLDPSRVRALIAGGALRADKLGGRWLVHWESVVARQRAPVPPGRPFAPHNALALLLEASGESVPGKIEPVARWRRRQALQHGGLLAIARRLDRRARVQQFWSLPGELRALRGDDALVLTGSSAAGALRLELAAPDAIDAYLPLRRLDQIVSGHALQEAPSSQANVTLRAVPDEAWLLDGRRIAPRAAVALDLTSYVDPRSSRVGTELLEWLSHGIPAER